MVMTITINAPTVYNTLLTQYPSQGHGPPSWKKSKLGSCLIACKGRTEMQSGGWQKQNIQEKENFFLCKKQLCGALNVIPSKSFEHLLGPLFVVLLEEICL